MINLYTDTELEKGTIIKAEILYINNFSNGGNGFPKEKLYNRLIFWRGKSTPGLFFREEDICREKVYATTIGGSIKQGGVGMWIAHNFEFQKIRKI